MARIITRCEGVGRRWESDGQQNLIVRAHIEQSSPVACLVLSWFVFVADEIRHVLLCKVTSPSPPHDRSQHVQIPRPSITGPMCTELLAVAREAVAPKGARHLSHLMQAETKEWSVWPAKLSAEKPLLEIPIGSKAFRAPREFRTRGCRARESCTEHIFFDPTPSYTGIFIEKTTCTPRAPVAMADEAETFIQHPLQLDPTSKAISAPTASHAGLSTELEALNSLHRALLNLDSPNVPPPPRPINPKRSAQVSKLRDSANAAYRKAAFTEAIRLYTYAIDMALGRPAWEPLGLVREELAPLYANRAQAHMSQQDWPEGWIDAQLSIECNEETNTKAWWRGGKCLVEMGRWEEAIEWLQKGLEAEGRASDGGRELKALLDDAEKGLERMRQGHAFSKNSDPSLCLIEASLETLLGAPRQGTRSSKRSHAGGRHAGPESLGILSPCSLKISSPPVPNARLIGAGPPFRAFGFRAAAKMIWSGILWQDTQRKPATFHSTVFVCGAPSSSGLCPLEALAFEPCTPIPQGSTQRHGKQAQPEVMPKLAGRHREIFGPAAQRNTADSTPRKG
ncbi:conserved hypothetical protein [Uncinocarpus reesii 1704]|uniref:Uncharacterized protein n=1 Tax=Uncinocarpus reesii (strain UAMH 1704) TaxID=336963 RepID=C4JHB1_UNCRE|nr:uncharacterized protein UREG_02684 [Uncinocarpus reesii 1704]EEP77835.1 conserved hypothetical protein [Uncinocarpus reesii 1704]